MIMYLCVIGCVFLGLMSCVLIMNIVGRFFFQHPLKGTVELIEAMMIIVAFFSIPYTAAKRAHVSVTLIVSRFSKGLQNVLRGTGYFLSACIIGIITYQAVIETIYYARHLNETTPILFVPLAPFRLIMGLGCLVLCFRLVLDAFQPAQPGEGRNLGVKK